MFLKAEAKFLIVISRDIAGSVFAYIDDFKKLDSIFFFPNTKALGKFEFKCLMSYIFANEFQKLSPRLSIFANKPYEGNFSDINFENAYVSS